MSDYLETWLDSESAGQNVIAVKTIYIDINDGCLTDGFLFSQIVYWSGKNKKGQYRASVIVNSQRWIVKEADEWFAECRIKDSTARASLDRIVKRGLIIKEVHRHRGLARTHIRINPEVFEARIKLALQDLPMPRIAEIKQSGKLNPGLPKSSKAELPKSSNVYTDIIESDIQETISTDVDIVAENAKTHLSADTSKLSLEAQTLLKELETWTVITRHQPCFKQDAVEELLHANLIEATFGPDGRTIMSITAKKPRPISSRPMVDWFNSLHHYAVEGAAVTLCNQQLYGPDGQLRFSLTPLTVDPAICPMCGVHYTPQPLTGSQTLPDSGWGQFVGEGETARLLQKQLAALKEATDHIDHAVTKVDPVAQLNAELTKEFAPLSKGGGGEDKSPAPQSLQNMPQVPEGYEARWSYDLLDIADDRYIGASTRHYIPNRKKRSLCGLYPRYEKSDTSFRADNSLVHPPRQCPDCAAKAAQPRAAKRATKAAKPAIFSDARIFEAIGLFAFNAKDKAELKANGGRIGRIRNKLCQFVVDKLGHEPSPEEIDKLLKRLAGFGAWYDKACDGCSRPAGEDTFVSWWVKYVADKSGNGAGDKLPQGDFSEPVWIDRLFVKREGGKLYCRPQVGEWREAVPSEIEKWQ